MTSQKRLLWLSVTIAVLLCVGCGVSRHISLDASAMTPSSSDVVTLSSVQVNDQKNDLQIIVTASAPFTYSVTDAAVPPSITVNIPNAYFVELPPVLSVERGGLKYITLDQIPGAIPAVRLRLHLTHPTAYRVSKNSERLVVSPQLSSEVALKPSHLPTSLHTPPTHSPVTRAYRVGPADVLDISVYGEPDLSKQLPVNEDGFISFPMIGQIAVQSLTTQEIQSVLEQSLSQGYLVHPHVTVLVTDYQSQQALVLGAVQQPGLYTLRGHTTLLEIIMQAGGLSPDGRAGKSLVWVRKPSLSNGTGNAQEQELQTLHVDLDQLMNYGDASLNIPVQHQDVIYVPQPSSIVVFGAVSRPGAIVASDKITLMEALSKTGGFTEHAAPNRTTIIRLVEGVERILHIDVTDITKRGDRSQNIVLKPNDIVVVPTSIF